MINFRFHIVSLTAVFLALALGVLVGSTVIERGIVDGLNNRIEAVNQRAQAAERENERLAGELDRRNEVAATTEPLLVAGRLTDVPVVLVAVRGADEGRVEALLGALTQAGASVGGIVWLTDRWLLDERDEDMAALAKGADVSALGSVGSVRREAIGALARALRQPAGEDPTLRGLSDARFVDLPGGDGFAVAPDSRLVVVSDANARVPNEVLAVPLVAALLALEGSIVVAAEGEREVNGRSVRTAFVGPLRGGSDGPDGDGVLSTVDDLEAVAGRLAVVTILEDPVSRRGHYGVGDRAQALLPVLAPT